MGKNSILEALRHEKQKVVVSELIGETWHCKLIVHGVNFWYCAQKHSLNFWSLRCFHMGLWFMTLWKGFYTASVGFFRHFCHCPLTGKHWDMASACRRRGSRQLALWVTGALAAVSCSSRACGLLQLTDFFPSYSSQAGAFLASTAAQRFLMPASEHLFLNCLNTTKAWLPETLLPAISAVLGVNRGS